MAQLRFVMLARHVSNRETVNDALWREDYEGYWWEIGSIFWLTLIGIIVSGEKEKLCGRQL